MPLAGSQYRTDAPRIQYIATTTRGLAASARGRAPWLLARRIRDTGGSYSRDRRKPPMEKIIMSDKIKSPRRRFLEMATDGISAVQLAFSGLARAQSSQYSLSPSIATAGMSNASFGNIKQIDAGVFNIGYAESGPHNGPVVILLHGWPYDIHSYVDVAPLLAAAGHRFIVPHTRGHGTTRFLSDSTLRNAQQS